MEPVTRFPILELPTELVLLILSYAAQPTFSQTERCDAENPYSSALALSRVSRLFRRAVLPKMLHTVSLSPFHSLRNFERALRMQKAYAQQNHHLHFEYASHVHRIWLGNSLSSEFVIGLDFSLLAEVLLAAESLAINFECLSFLVPRLDLAWDSHMAKNIDHTRSPLPRSTKTLTIWEDEDNFLDRHIIKGSPFIASISHLISLSHPAYTSRHVPGRNDGDLGSGDYKLPKWMAHAPWDCFTSLQTVSVALPLIICQAPLPLASTIGTNLQVELLRFPASLVMDDEVPREIRASTGTISLDDVRVKLSRGCVHYCAVCQDWEQPWACALLG